MNKKKILHESDFNSHPIWIWDETNEYRVPFSNKKEITWEDAATFFIKAKFTTNQHQFNGYLVGNITFFAFSIYANQQTLAFNLHSHSLNSSNIEKLFQILKCKPFDFFPIYFESDVRPAGGDKISGFLRERSLKCD